MANHNYYFTPEVESVLNELRIDSIRENKEMSEQQVVIECILEKFSRKHGSKNAPLVEENDADEERCESVVNNSECWTVKDAMSYINKQTKRKNSNSIIYNAANNHEIKFFHIGKRYYFNPQDVKKWLDNHTNHKVYKTDKATPPPHSEERTEKASLYGRAA